MAISLTTEQFTAELATTIADPTQLKYLADLLVKATMKYAVAIKHTPGVSASVSVSNIKTMSISELRKLPGAFTISDLAEYSKKAKELVPGLKRTEFESVEDAYMYLKNEEKLSAATYTSIIRLNCIAMGMIDKAEKTERVVRGTTEKSTTTKKNTPRLNAHNAGKTFLSTLYKNGTELPEAYKSYMRKTRPGWGDAMKDGKVRQNGKDDWAHIWSVLKAKSTSGDTDADLYRGEWNDKFVGNNTKEVIDTELSTIVDMLDRLCQWLLLDDATGAPVVEEKRVHVVKPVVQAAKPAGIIKKPVVEINSDVDVELDGDGTGTEED